MKGSNQSLVSWELPTNMPRIEIQDRCHQIRINIQRLRAYSRRKSKHWPKSKIQQISDISLNFVILLWTLWIRRRDFNSKPIIILKNQLDSSWKLGQLARQSFLRIGTLRLKMAWSRTSTTMALSWDVNSVKNVEGIGASISSSLEV